MSQFSEFDNIEDSVSLEYRMYFFKPGTEPDTSVDFYEGLYQAWVNPPEILVNGEIASLVGKPEPFARLRTPAGSVFDLKGRKTAPGRLQPFVKQKK